MPVDDISQLLRAWSDGDQLALGELTPIVYAELRRLAHRYMRGERSNHSLQTTALVNEAYMRLVDYKRMQWQNRAHFFAVSAQLMRRIWSTMHDVITSNADAACSMSRWMRRFS
jgi:RNA polymerase sigma factor (TIGR02999 family)